MKTTGTIDQDGRKATTRTGAPVLRRLTTFAGQFGLLAVLGLIAATLVTAIPRLTNDAADQALRNEIDTLSWQVRDLTVQTRTPLDRGEAPGSGMGRLAPFQHAMPPTLAGLVDGSWYSIAFGPEDVSASGDFEPFRPGDSRQLMGLRAQTGVPESARLVAGAWPGTPEGRDGDRVGVAVSRRTAEILSLRIGARLNLATQATTKPVELTVVGIFEPLDANDPVWAEMPLALEPQEPIQDGDPYRSVVITDWAGTAGAAAQLGDPLQTWRYRLAQDRLDASLIDPVATAVPFARSQLSGDGLSLITSLDSVLLRFDRQLDSVAALLAVVQAGMLACLLGLVILAARLAVERRRTELALLRARGAGSRTIVGWTLAEGIGLQPAAVLAGWLLGSQVPGRPADSELPLVLLIGLVTTLAVPVLAVLSQRQVSFVAQRRDLIRHRPSARRVTAELCVLLLAGVGVFLLRRRGLSQASGVDPYLVSVPVLLAAGTALIALRLLPWPLRQLGRLTARARGVVLFLSLARAGRAAPVGSGPLVVLVLAITTGVFSGALAGTVDRARDQATDQAVAGDARLVGFAFAPVTAERLTALPGVTAVAPALIESNRELISEAGPNGRLYGQAQVVVVDAPTFTEVLANSGIEADLPADFTRTGRVDGPVPAIVSPEVAGLVGAGAVADVQGRRYGFSTVAVRTAVPGVDVGTRRFVVLPWQALSVPEWKPIIPNQYFLSGDGFDHDAVRRVADEGQREHRAAVLGRSVEVTPLSTRLITWSAHRQELNETGANGVLSLLGTAGLISGALFALLAVGFAVVAEAGSRGRVLSRLRTMGLTAGQGRQLLIYELLPLVGLAVIAGGVVGTVLPEALGPALGLDSFTAGIPARIELDPWLVAALLLVVLIGLATALVVENLANRRMRLGTVLRLGEES